MVSVNGMRKHIDNVRRMRESQARARRSAEIQRDLQCSKSHSGGSCEHSGPPSASWSKLVGAGKQSGYISRERKKTYGDRAGSKRRYRRDRLEK